MDTQSDIPEQEIDTAEIESIVHNVTIPSLKR